MQADPLQSAFDLVSISHNPIKSILNRPGRHPIKRVPEFLAFNIIQKFLILDSIHKLLPNLPRPSSPHLDNKEKISQDPLNSILNPQNSIKRVPQSSSRYSAHSIQQSLSSKQIADFSIFPQVKSKFKLIDKNHSNLPNRALNKIIFSSQSQKVPGQDFIQHSKQRASELQAVRVIKQKVVFDQVNIFFPPQEADFRHFVKSVKHDLKRSSSSVPSSHNPVSGRFDSPALEPVQGVPESVSPEVVKQVFILHGPDRPSPHVEAQFRHLRDLGLQGLQSPGEFISRAFDPVRSVSCHPSRDLAEQELELVGPALVEESFGLDVK